MTVPQIFTVAEWADVAIARRATRHMAASIGFTTVATERIVLAVSELATNLVRHAWSGEIILAVIERPIGSGRGT